METGSQGRRSVSLWQVVNASAIGSLLEWYDFYLYGTAAAVVFDKLFFPKFAPALGTLAAFATFGVGFLARPFGGLVFGNYGDKWGRKAVLVITILLVGGGTTLIGLLPPYSAIGVWAPVLLVFLRLVQGFGAGAEYGGAVILACEFAPGEKRGLYGSWAPMGVIVGLLLSTGIFAIFSALPEREFLAWGWRIPFLLSIILVGLGLYIRWRLPETPVFAEVSKTRPTLKVPVWDAMVRHPRSFLVVIGARMAENGLGYLFPVFGASYLVLNLRFSKPVALTAITIANFVELIMIPIWSVLSDRIGRRPVYAGAAAFSIVWAIPFFLLVDTRNIVLVTLAFAVAAGIGLGGMFGPQAAYFAELFGPRVRYSGFAFARELGSVLSGGPAPFLASLLVKWGNGKPWGVAVYIMVLALITLVAVILGPETYKTDLASEELEAQHAAQPRVAPT